ncbi:MAG: hypothetical protein K0S08_1213 [Gammaproteobacteria bacterium]|jgi:hypothetical protein|nr:hypothetical protein [Gammaproteobacteria bacterium]
MNLEQYIRSHFEQLFNLKVLFASKRKFQEWYQLTSFENQKIVDRLLEAYPNSLVCQQKIKALKASEESLRLELSNLQPQLRERLQLRLEKVSAQIAYLRNKQVERLTESQKAFSLPAATTYLNWLEIRLQKLISDISQQRKALLSKGQDVQKVKSDIDQLKKPSFTYAAQRAFLERKLKKCQGIYATADGQLRGSEFLERKLLMQKAAEESIQARLKELETENAELQAALASSDILRRKYLKLENESILALINDKHEQKRHYEILLVIAEALEKKELVSFEGFYQYVRGQLKVLIEDYWQEKTETSGGLSARLPVVDPLALERITTSFKIYLQDGRKIYSQRLDGSLYRPYLSGQDLPPSMATLSEKSGMSKKTKADLYKKSQRKRKFISPIARLMHYASDDIKNFKIALSKPSPLFVKGLRPETMGTHLAAAAENLSSPRSPAQHGFHLALSPEARPGKECYPIDRKSIDATPVLLSKLRALSIRQGAESLNPRADTPIPPQEGRLSPLSAEAQAILGQALRQGAPILSAPPTRPAPQPPSGFSTIAQRQSPPPQSKMFKPTLLSGRPLPPPPLAPDIQRATSVLDSSAVVTVPASPMIAKKDLRVSAFKGGLLCSDKPLPPPPPAPSLQLLAEKPGVAPALASFPVSISMDSTTQTRPAALSVQSALKRSASERFKPLSELSEVGHQTTTIASDNGCVTTFNPLFKRGPASATPASRLQSVVLTIKAQPTLVYRNPLFLRHQRPVSLPQDMEANDVPGLKRL